MFSLALVLFNLSPCLSVSPCVEPSQRWSGIHLTYCKQEVYIAFYISAREIQNNINQTNYICIGKIIQNELTYAKYSYRDERIE